MLATPRSIRNVGIVQVLLAASFVIWLFFFPDSGGNFAWPVVPRITAMFLGASFLARLYLGWHLFRQPNWWMLRWQLWGNYGFLTIIFLATFWHVDEMNWHSNIWVAHIWVIAYIVEPLVLPLWEPRGPQARLPLPPEHQQGPILPALKSLMVLILIVGVTLSGLMFINPEFMDTRWPWPLDPFDARILSAFHLLAALWALRVYFFDDWAEAKLGVGGLIVYTLALTLAWAVNLPDYDLTRNNTYVAGLLVGVPAVLLIYFYWRQERGAYRA